MQGFKVETNYPFHVFFPLFWGVWKLEKDHPWRILRVPQNTFVFSGASPLPVGVHVTLAQGGRRGWLDLRAWGRGRSCKMRGIFSFISVPGICGCWRRRSPKHNRCFFCFFVFFCIAQKIGGAGGWKEPNILQRATHSPKLPVMSSPHGKKAGYKEIQLIYLLPDFLFFTFPTSYRCPCPAEVIQWWPRTAFRSSPATKSMTLENPLVPSDSYSIPSPGKWGGFTNWSVINLFILRCQ